MLDQPAIEFDLSAIEDPIPPSPAPAKRKFGGPQPGSGRPKKHRPAKTIDEVFPSLPDSTNPQADALWCWNNSERMAVEQKDGTTLIYWERAKDRPPSRGVETWMVLRTKAGYKDFSDRLYKAATGRDDSEEENDIQRYEKRRLQEVRQILEAMMA